jgi:ribose transport system permease protein
MTDPNAAGVLPSPPAGRWTVPSWGPLLLALLVIAAAFQLLSPNGVFLNPRNLSDIAANSTEVGIMAVGATLVLIVGGIDLSIGGVLAFSSILGAKIMTGQSDPAVVLLALAAMIVSGAAWGLLNGLLAVRLGIPAFIVTLGTLGMSVGLGYLLTNGIAVAGIPEGLQRTFGFNRLGGIVPAPVLLFAGVTIVGGIVLRLTRFGRRSYAIGSSRPAAERSGIPVRRHLIIVYIISGTLAGLAGAVDVSRFASAAVAAHSTDILPVISAVVIGGTSLFGGVGGVAGTVIGVILIGVLANGLVILGVDSYWQQVGTGALLIASVFIDQLRQKAQ